MTVLHKEPNGDLLVSWRFQVKFSESGSVTTTKLGRAVSDSDSEAEEDSEVLPCTRTPAGSAGTAKVPTEELKRKFNQLQSKAKLRLKA